MSGGRGGRRRQVRFDLPQALVTLTAMPDELVEIEVWPKSGVSAFVVVDAVTARGIADALRSMVTGPRGGTTPDGPPPDPDASEDEDEDEAPPPGIIDLASRRRPAKGA